MANIIDCIDPITIACVYSEVRIFPGALLAFKTITLLISWTLASGPYFLPYSLWA